MTSSRTYEYLAEKLSGRILSEKGFEETMRFARGNGKPSKGVTAHLSDAIERHMYRSKDKYILVDADGGLHAYGGRGWERIDQPNFMRELVKRILERLGVSVTYRTYSVDKIAGECMSGLTASDETLFVSDRRYVTFTNGVFDLKDGSLKDFHPRYMTDIMFDFAYKGDKEGYLRTNPDWERFRLWDEKIGEIFDNREMRDAFQMFCGTLLADRKEWKVEYICFLEGIGANGKSVAAHAVANMMGERYFAKYSPEQLLKGNHKDYYMADLRGKLCNLCDDLDEKVISGGDFKRMVSGEQMQGRECGGARPLKITPPLFICCTNSMPQTSDDSWGDQRRRLRLLTTRMRFGEDRKKDPQLTYKLMSEPCRQRIFNWMYEGYQRVRRSNGEIPISDDVYKAMQELMEESTPKRRWASERGYSKKKDDPGEGMTPVLLSDLLSDYKGWCVRNGESDGAVTNSQKLSSFLWSVLGYEKKPTNRGTVFMMPPTGVNL